ncbi:hypothetical protein BpHYR1_021478, partial [Brachionus plicatilis]
RLIKIPDKINLCGKNIKVVTDVVLLGFKIDHDLNFSKLDCNATIKLAKSYYFSMFKLFNFKYDSQNYDDKDVGDLTRGFLHCV